MTGQPASAGWFSGHRPLATDHGPCYCPAEVRKGWTLNGTGERRTLGEPSSSGFAARYAAALYDLAFERNQLDRVVDEMAALGRLLAESPDLRRLVASPLTDVAKAGPALNQALRAQDVSEIVRNFIAVAIANRRLRDLLALIAGFAAYVAQKRGETIADVSSAHALSDLQRNQLRARLTEAGYGSVKLIEHVDAALLGGLVLKIGAKLYDTSLKSRLSRLNYSLKGAA